MKWPLNLVNILFLLSLFSCTQVRKNSKIVSEVYIHQYNVPMSKKDWNERGGNGQISYVYNDGRKVNEHYKGHILEGKSTYTYPYSENLQKSLVYSQGELKEENYFFINGTPELKRKFIAYTPSKIEETTWYAEGVPKSFELYEGGKLSEGSYYTKQHDIDSSVKKGVGTRTLRDINGILLQKDSINSGEVTMQTILYSNGDVKELIPCKEGKTHGRKQFFGENGLPLKIEEWSMGVKEGVEISFQNGVKFQETPYFSGKKEGTGKIYDAKNQLVEEITYRNDARHGPSYFYLNNEIHTKWFFRGNKVNKLRYDQLTAI